MTHRTPDPMLPECAGCGRQEPGTTERPVKLVPCSTCEVPYCSDRYGVSTRGEQYRGWAAIEAEPSSTAVDHAIQLLARLGEVNPAEVRSDSEACRRAYRAAARKHHPDVGGDPDLFRRLTEARDLLVGASR